MSVMGDSRFGDVRSGKKHVLRPVVGLTERLPAKDLERITIDAMRLHRRLRDRAEALYTESDSGLLAASLVETVGQARLDYVQAMIEMHAQQVVLSTLLDVLGYVPKAPED